MAHVGLQYEKRCISDIFANVFEIRGKTALITGGAKRLGRYTALELARAGCNVVVHYRNSANDAESLRKEIRALGVDSWSVQANLSQPDEARELIPRSIEVGGSIDYLVNSASIFPADSIDGLTEESLHANLRVNTLSPLSLANGLRKHLEGTGRSGCVVNFLDTRILDYDRDHISYHLSKRSLFSLTRIMSAEYAPRLRVNAVAPGLVLPPPGEDDSYLDRLAHTNPLQTHGSGEQIAKTVLFLVWNEFITGQVVYVDGGRHMTGRFYGS